MIRSVRARRVVFSLSAWLLCAGMRAATYLPMSDADLIRQLERLYGFDQPAHVRFVQMMEEFKG